MGIKRLFIYCFFAITTALSAQSVTEHVVVKGNTLYSLSKQYGITVSELREANPQIAGTALGLGDVLIVPPPVQPEPVTVDSHLPNTAKQDTTESTPAFEMYKVRRGDSQICLPFIALIRMREQIGNVVFNWSSRSMKWLYSKLRRIH